MELLDAELDSAVSVEDELTASSLEAASLLLTDSSSEELDTLDSDDDDSEDSDDVDLLVDERFVLDETAVCGLDDFWLVIMPYTGTKDIIASANTTSRTRNPLFGDFESDFRENFGSSLSFLGRFDRLMLFGSKSFIETTSILLVHIKFYHTNTDFAHNVLLRMKPSL